MRLECSVGHTNSSHQHLSITSRVRSMITVAYKHWLAEFIKWRYYTSLFRDNLVIIQDVQDRLYVRWECLQLRWLWLPKIARFNQKHRTGVVRGGRRLLLPLCDGAHTPQRSIILGRRTLPSRQARLLTLSLTLFVQKPSDITDRTKKYVVAPIVPSSSCDENK